MRAWAVAASTSGKVESITGATVRAANSGQTCLVERLGHRRLEGDRPVAQRRAGMGQPLDHQEADRNLGLVAVLGADLDDAAFLGRGGVVAGDIVAADQVDDDVGAVASVISLTRATKSSWR